MRRSGQLSGNPTCRRTSYPGSSRAERAVLWPGNGVSRKVDCGGANCADQALVRKPHFTTANAHGFDHFMACGLRTPEWNGRVSFVLNPSVYLSDVWLSQAARGRYNLAIGDLWRVAGPSRNSITGPRWRSALSLLLASRCSAPFCGALGVHIPDSAVGCWGTAALA